MERSWAPLPVWVADDLTLAAVFHLLFPESGLKPFFPTKATSPRQHCWSESLHDTKGWSGDLQVRLDAPSKWMWPRAKQGSNERPRSDLWLWLKCTRKNPPTVSPKWPSWAFKCYKEVRPLFALSWFSGLLSSGGWVVHDVESQYVYLYIYIMYMHTYVQAHTHTHI